MPPLSTVLAANAAFSPSYLPLAVFVGGTSGIGRATAHAFAQRTKGNAHIIIVGRNKTAADALFASFPTPADPAAAKREFVPCDASLVRNVHATTAALLARLPKINFLVLTPGFMSFKGRDETEEGIDRRLALHYYVRWQFVYDLAPLLQRARDTGEDAAALSVMGAGHTVSIDTNDFGLRKRYLSANMGFVSPTYTDLMMQSFSEQYPSVAFVHTNPGVVRTELFQRAHWTMRFLNPLLMALAYPFTVSSDDCGEYTLYSLLQSNDGFFRRDSRGDDAGRAPLHGAEDVRNRLWDHTKEEIGRALATRT